jgi:WD40 repeat protein
MGPLVDRTVAIDIFKLLKERKFPLALSSVDPSSGEESLCLGHVYLIFDNLLAIETSDDTCMTIPIAGVEFFRMDPAHAPPSLKAIAWDTFDTGMQFKADGSFCYVLTQLPKPNSISQATPEPASLAPCPEKSVPSDFARWELLEPLDPEQQRKWDKFKLPASRSMVQSVALSLAGDLLVSGCGTNLMEPAIYSGRRLATLQGHWQGVMAVALPAAGHILATVSDFSPIVLWDPRTARCLRLVGEHNYMNESVAFSASGDLLASPQSEDGLVRVWDLRTGLPVCELDRGGIVALSAAGDVLAVVSGDQISVWDTGTGRCRLELEDYMNTATSVAISAFGNFFASPFVDEGVSVWDSRTGEVIFEGKQDEVTSVSLSSEGDLLASGSTDRTAKVWDVRSGSLIHSFAGHSGVVSSVALSFDGRYLVTGSHDGTVKLWNVMERRLVATFMGIDGEEWVTYTPDGYFIGSDRMMERSGQEFLVGGAPWTEHVPPLENPNPAKVQEALRTKHPNH